MTTKHKIVKNQETMTVQELLNILNKIEDKSMPVTMFTEVRPAPYLYYPTECWTAEKANEKGYFAINTMSLKKDMR